jgi:hypothetical protein
MIRVSYWLNDGNCQETYVKEAFLSIFIGILLEKGYTINTIGDQ